MRLSYSLGLACALLLVFAESAPAPIAQDAIVPETEVALMNPNADHTVRPEICNPTTHFSCSIYGACTGGFWSSSKTCKCVEGFEGFSCDLGPNTADFFERMTPFSQELASAAVELSTVAYYNTAKLNRLCPGISETTSSYKQTLLHGTGVNFATSGVLEGINDTGIAGKDCNWQCYLDRYQDLQNAFGASNVAQAQAHYENHGKSEKRDCTCPGVRSGMPFVAFRGTESKENWMQDGTFYTNEHTLSGKKMRIHRGFWKAVDTNGPQLLKHVANAMKGRKQHSLLITGHSMGGAMANVFTVWLKHRMPDLKIHLITVASPRVGDARFARAVESGSSSAVRIVNAQKESWGSGFDYDVAALVPNYASSFGWTRTWYQHAGVQITMGVNDNTKQVSPGPLEPLGFALHYPKTYVTRIKQLMKARPGLLGKAQHTEVCVGFPSVDNELTASAALTETKHSLMNQTKQTKQTKQKKATHTKSTEAEAEHMIKQMKQFLKHNPKANVQVPRKGGADGTNAGHDKLSRLVVH